MRKNIHYAWVVCAGCAIMIFCTSGLTNNAFSIFMPYLLSVNGFTNSQLSLMITIRNLTSLICMLFSGWYFKLFKLRRGMTAAGIIILISYIIFSVSDNIYMYYIGYAFIGIGHALGAMIPITMMICNWFAESRNTALGICASATGIANVTMPTVINKLIESLGLHAAFMLVGVLIFVFVAVSYMLIRDYPEDLNLKPLGVVKDSKNIMAQNVGIEKKDWLILTPMLIMLGASLSVAYSDISVLITGEGYSVDIAAIVIQISGIAVIVCKLGTGKLGDKIGNFKCNFVCGAIYITGLILCCFIRKNLVILFAGIILFSGGNGATGLCISKWSADLATTEDRDKVVRRFQMIYTLGGLLFSPLPGIIADKNAGSYSKAYWLFTILAVLVYAMIQIMYILIRKRREKNQIV